MNEPKKPRKRAPSRDAQTGKFEAASLDPDQLHELVRVVRAIRDIEPVLAGTVLALRLLPDGEESASMAALCGFYLAELKRSALEQLEADPESLKDAKKLRLDAKRLGNMPLSEQQRLQQLAQEWALEGVTPAKLASARPEVLKAIMGTVFAVGLLRAPGGLGEALQAVKGGESKALE